MRSAAFTLLLAACAAQPASEIREAVQVVDRGDHLDVTAYFASNDTSIKLDDDLLAVTFRGETHLLPYSNVTYGGPISIATPVVADEPVELSIKNAGETLVATLTAPPPITLDPVPAEVSRGGEFPVSFSPGSSDTTGWMFHSDCAWGSGTVATGANKIVIQPSDLQEFKTGTCAAGLELTRTRQGQPPAQVYDGQAEFMTIANTTFSSTP